MAIPVISHFLSPYSSTWMCIHRRPYPREKSSPSPLRPRVTGMGWDVLSEKFLGGIKMSTDMEKHCSLFLDP